MSGVDLHDVDRLTVGTVGPPGQRVFYLQARAGGTIVTLKVEKTQVQALAEFVARLLSDLPAAGELPDDLELQEPVDPRWSVGAIGLRYDDGLDRIVLQAEEFVPPPFATGDPDDPDAGLVDDEEDDDEPAGDVVRFWATRAQMAALAIRATTLVESGRPPCPLCGHPLDPRGHTCPRKNGSHPPQL